MKRGKHPNSQKNLRHDKLPTGHSTATVRVSGPKEAVEKFGKETAAERGRIAEAHYRIPTEKFPPIPINQPKP